MEKTRILLVEDENYNIELTRTYLKDKFEVDSARTGAEALQLANSYNYPIVLMDIQLHESKDGTQLMKEFHEIRGYENCYIIAITAYAGKDEKEKFLNAGFNYYLSKPFSKDRLNGFLNKVAENYISRQNTNL